MYDGGYFSSQRRPPCGMPIKYKLNNVEGNSARCFMQVQLSGTAIVMGPMSTRSVAITQATNIY